jgi:hypothetical protein
MPSSLVVADLLENTALVMQEDSGYPKEYLADARALSYFYSFLGGMYAYFGMLTLSQGGLTLAGVLWIIAALVVSVGGYRNWKRSRSRLTAEEYDRRTLLAQCHDDRYVPQYRIEVSAEGDATILALKVCSTQEQKRLPRAAEKLTSPEVSLCQTMPEGDKGHRQDISVIEQASFTGTDTESLVRASEYRAELEAVRMEKTEQARREYLGQVLREREGEEFRELLESDS